MTATVSSKRGAALFRIKFGLRKNSSFMLALGGLYAPIPLAILLLAISCCTDDITASKFALASQATVIIAAVTFFAAMLLCIARAYAAFSYLNKKPESDMQLSLPMNKRQRFIGDYAGGLLTIVLPLIIMLTAALLIGVAGYIFIPPEVANAHGFYIGYNELFMLYLRLTPILITAMATLFGMTSIIVICCGNQMAASGCIILEQLVAVAEPVICFLYVINNAFGIVNDNYDAFISALAWLSPFGLAFLSAIMDISLPYPVILFTAILIAGLWAALTYFLYARRKPENAGKYTVFKGFGRCLVFLTIFFGGIAAFTVNTKPIREQTVGILFAAAIVIVLVLFICSALLEKGNKKVILKTAGFCAASFVVTIGMLLISESTGMFGLVYSVPKASDISSAKVSISSVLVPSPLYATGEEQEITEFTDPEDIALITEINKSITDNYKARENRPSLSSMEWKEELSDTAYGSIIISYETKGGRTIKRCYPIFAEEYKKILELEYSDEMVAANCERMKESLTSWNEYRKSEASVPTDKEIYVYGKAHSFMTNEVNTFAVKDYKDDFATRFAEAYTADVMALSVEERMRPPESSLGCVRIGDVWSEEIYPSYKNTLALLKEREMSFPEIDYSKAWVYGVVSPTELIDANPGLEEYSIFDTDNGHLRGRITLKYDLRDTPDTPYYFNEKTGEFNINEDVQTLLKAALPKYISEEPCYTIVTGGGMLYIPPAYSELAEKVYNEQEVCFE